MPKIVTGQPALLIDDALVIGDLHIGIEAELFAKGVRLASGTDKMLASLKELIADTGAKHVIVLGDLKHRIASVSAQEWGEIPPFIEAVKRQADVTVVLGNHDAGLREPLERLGVEVHPPSGFAFHDYGLIHGNAKPDPALLAACSYFIASHWHPIFEFIDPLGGRVVEKLWCEARLSQELGGAPLLIMPSFNPLITGVPPSRLSAQWLDLKGAKMFLLDGVFLGEYVPKPATAQKTARRRRREE